MIIIHTADLHLSQNRPERLEVLQWIIKTAAREKGDLIIIAGDLFDSDKDSTLLRTDAKKMIEASKIPVLISSGNHDPRSYGADTDYGNNAIILYQTPFHTVEIDSLRFAAIPYQEKKFSECMKSLPKNIDVLIAHGTLYDTKFIFSLIEDSDTAYMPILPQNLEGIARYVALGHLHSQHRSFQYDNTVAAYPGSAIATDIKCAGPRVIYKVHVEPGTITVKPVEIDIASYYVIKEFCIFPDNQDRIIEDIMTYLKTINDRRMIPSIYINGFTSINEIEFKGQIKKIEEDTSCHYPGLKININIQDWHLIMEHNLVRRFVEKSANIDPVMRMKIYELAFPVFYDFLK